MANEQMSQDEIDELLKDVKTGGIVDINTRTSSCVDKNEANAVKTALERLQFAQENGMCAQEIRIRAWQLKYATHALWLVRHGYTRREWRDKVRKYFAQNPGLYRFFCYKRELLNKD